MMHIKNKRAKETLIRFARIAPFVLCSILCIGYLESVYAMAFENYSIYDEEIVLYKPISWWIGDNILVYGKEIAFGLTLMSFSLDMCWYNHCACFYLIYNVYQCKYFAEHIYDNEIYYAVCIVNIIIAAYLTYKGLRILITKTK